MTVSFARMEKGRQAMTWGLAACLPASGIARISNLGSHAGGHSAPNSPSNGPAVLTDELPPQGRPIQTPDVAVQPGRSSLRRATGGRAVLLIRRDRLFLHLDRRPAKNADQHVSKPFGSVAPSVFGFFHEHIMGVSNAESVASAYAQARR